MPENERCFYECIEEKTPCKMHFDFETKKNKGPMDDDLKQASIDLILMILLHYLKCIVNGLDYAK